MAVLFDKYDFPVFCEGDYYDRIWFLDCEIFFNNFSVVFAATFFYEREELIFNESFF